MTPKALAKIPEGFPEALLMTFCSSSARSSQKIGAMFQAPSLNRKRRKGFY
jgi:hypothetical protein